MNRHGVLLPREDGTSARCFGPGSCPECNKDMADAPVEAMIDYVTKEVGRRWSMPSADLRPIMAWALSCVAARNMAYEEAPTDGLVRVQVTLPQADAELQLMSALDQLCSRGDNTAQETARAVRWLGTKYDPQYVEER